MSFFGQIAAASDRKGIESRVNDDTLFVPITSDPEVQFVTIDEDTPAAEAHVTATDVNDEDDEFEAVLVSAVFSVEDTVTAVAHRVAADQVAGLLRALLDGGGDRIADLEFEQDPGEATLVTSEVGTSSLVQVLVIVHNNEPSAYVRFIVQGVNSDDIVDQAIAEFQDSDTETVLTDDDRRRTFVDLYSDVRTLCNEVLMLGTFKDFDKLMDVLALVVDRAEEWEDQLAPIDDGYAEYIYPDHVVSLDEDDDDEDDDDLYDDGGCDGEDDEEGDDSEQPYCDSAVTSARPLMGEKKRARQDTAVAARSWCQSSCNDV